MDDNELARQLLGYAAYAPQGYGGNTLAPYTYDNSQEALAATDAGARTQLYGPQGALARDRADFAARVHGGLQDYLAGAQALQPHSASDLAYMVPGVGNALSAYDAYNAFGNRDYVGGALAGIGAVPLLGGMFGGPLSRTADHAALAKAGEMLGAGHSAEDIWKATGWFQGADKKWRYEIPDNQAALLHDGDTFHPQWKAYADANEDYPRVEDLLRHERLMAAYPETMRTEVRLLPRGEDASGWLDHQGDIYVNRGLSRGEVTPTLLHEMQHEIQGREGFPYGAGLYQEIPDDVYHRLAGEVEARNVEARMNMTPEERLARPPWTTQDVPYENQILRFGQR